MGSEELLSGFCKFKRLQPRRCPVPFPKEIAMRATIGSVHYDRRHAGSRREASPIWHSTVGIIITLALLAAPFPSEGQ